MTRVQYLDETASVLLRGLGKNINLFVLYLAVCKRWGRLVFLAIIWQPVRKKEEFKPCCCHCKIGLVRAGRVNTCWHI